MKLRKTFLLLPLAWVACTAADAAVTAAPKPLPKSLKKAMKDIEEDWHCIEQALDSDPTKDLQSLATAAVRCAEVMKLAYDPFEDKEVPDFAKLAREAEAGLQEFAKAAAAGDGETVRKLGTTLHKQHCVRCHDAVEEVHG